MRKRPSDKPSIYLDTNVVSVMFGRPNLVADVHHQLITREWWDSEHRYSKVYGSSILEDELASGKYTGQDRAVALVRRLPYLPVTRAIREAARRLMEERVVPQQKHGDALQLACATVHAIDYLLTWNHAHLMNADTQRKLNLLSKRESWRSPTLVSPESIPKVLLDQNIRRSDDEE